MNKTHMHFGAEFPTIFELRQNTPSSGVNVTRKLYHQFGETLDNIMEHPEQKDKRRVGKMLYWPVGLVLQKRRMLHAPFTNVTSVGRTRVSWLRYHKSRTTAGNHDNRSATAARVCACHYRHHHDHPSLLLNWPCKKSPALSGAFG